MMNVRRRIEGLVCLGQTQCCSGFVTVLAIAGPQRIFIFQEENRRAQRWLCKPLLG